MTTAVKYLCKGIKVFVLRYRDMLGKRKINPSIYGDYSMSGLNYLMSCLNYLMSCLDHYQCYSGHLASCFGYSTTSLDHLIT